jgi:hypothetical protein
VIRGTGGISRISGKMGHGWVHMKIGNKEKVILCSRGKQKEYVRVRSRFRLNGGFSS